MLLRLSAVPFLLHTDSLEELSMVHDMQLPLRRFSKETEPYTLSFGTLDIGEGVCVPLLGQIKCPFSFVNRAISETLDAAHELLWGWAVDRGFFENSDKSRAKFDQYNLVQFAAYTVLNIPEIDIDVYTEVKINGKSIPEIVQTILENSTPLKPEQLFRQSKYLLWLFRHDNWAETHSDTAFVRQMHARFLTTLKTGKAKPLTQQAYSLLRNGGTQEEFKFMNTLMTSIADIGKDFNLAFHNLGFFESEKYLGYPDFCASVGRYLEDQATEATYHTRETPVSHDLARRIRKEACGVYTVNYAALAECKIPIPRKEHSLSPRIVRIGEAFSYLICHFNDLISAPREVGKSNWKNNEIAMLLEEQAQVLKEPGDPTILHYTMAVERLFEKTNSDLQDALIDMESIGDTDFGSSTPAINQDLLPTLTYVAVMQQWAIGSMPAQMALDCYSKHRPEGPYIKKGECMNGDSDFWRFAFVYKI